MTFTQLNQHPVADKQTFFFARIRSFSHEPSLSKHVRFPTSYIAYTDSKPPPVMICQLRKTCARSYDFHYGWTRPFPLRIFGCKHGNRSFPRFNAIRVFSVEKAQKRIPFTHSRAHWCTVKKKISGLVYFCEDIPWFCASCIYILIYDISLIWYHTSEKRFQKLEYVQIFFITIIIG